MATFYKQVSNLHSRLQIAVTCSLLTAISGLFSIPAVAADKSASYQLSIDRALTILKIKTCLPASAHAIDLSAGDADAPLFIDSFTYTGYGPPQSIADVQEHVHIPASAAPTCIHYSVDLQRAVSHRGSWIASRYGQSILVDPADFLWLPDNRHEDTTIKLALPNGVAASVPWKPLGDSTYAIPARPNSWLSMAAFGPFVETTLALGPARLQLAMIDIDSERRQHFQQWFLTTAGAVVDIVGRFPVDTPQILVVGTPPGKMPVPSAHVLRGGGTAVHIFLDTTRPESEFENDWTTTHELAHLLLPFVDRSSIWLSEGVASYYQYILMARLGRITPQQAWSRLYHSFNMAQQQTDVASLDEATQRHLAGDHTYCERVYWTGAAMMFMADVQLRVSTDNRLSLDTLLRRLYREHLDTTRAWRAQELFAKLDELAGQPVFATLWRQLDNGKSFPAITGTLHNLGIEGGDIEGDHKGVLLLNNTPSNQAPWAAVRRAIMAPTPQAMDSHTAP